MTRQRLHASFLAAASITIAGAILGVSCRPLEGQSGVHVSVALAATGWSTTDQFDHITVTATSGSSHAVVCLSTVQGNASAFADAGYRDGGSDPCADRGDLAWTTVPTASTWHLDQAARTINFEFPDSAPVHVVAEARLGGLSAVGSAAGDSTASIGGGTLDLRLAKLASAPGSCGITYGASVEADAATAAICTLADDGGAPVDCLCAKTSGPMPKDCLGITTGLSCSENNTHLTIDPTKIAPGCPTNDVGRGITRAMTTCLLVATTVRMFRCLDAGADGTCLEPTADCIPPEAGIVIREPQTGEANARLSLDCLPPTVFGIPISAQLNIDPRGRLSIPWIGLDVGRLDDPRACKVDIDPVTFIDCPAPR